MAGGNKSNSPKVKKRKSQQRVAANKATEVKKNQRFDRGPNRQTSPA